MLSQKEKHFLFYFILVFSLIFALLKLANPQPINLGVAYLQEKILSQAGYDVIRSGTTIVAHKTAFQIIVDCSGLIMMAMFFALLYSTKTKIPHWKLLAYFAFFFVFNLLRIAFTIGIGADYGQEAIDVIHPVLWFVDSGVVFACWAYEYGLFKKP